MKGVNKMENASVTKQSLYGFIADNNQHYLQEDYFKFLEYFNSDDIKAKKWSGTSWINETISSRLQLFTTENEFRNLTVEASDFITDDSKIITKNNIETCFIKEVYAHTSDKNIPDVLYKQSTIDMASETMQAVWVNINVPLSAVAGIYNGSINIKSEDAVILSFDYSLEVLNIVQPDIADCDIQMEIWQYPYSAERYYSGKSTSEYYGNNVCDLYYVHLNDLYSFPRKLPKAFSIAQNL